MRLQRDIIDRLADQSARIILLTDDARGELSVPSRGGKHRRKVRDLV